MGYYHRIGIIEKKHYEKIKELPHKEFIKIFQDEEEGYCSSHILFKHFDAKKIYVIGELDYRHKYIANLVFKNKKNFAEQKEIEGCEIFIPEQKDFFLKLSEAYWLEYLEYIQKTSVEVLGIHLKEYAGLLFNKRGEEKEFDFCKKDFNSFFFVENDFIIKDDSFNYMSINFHEFHKKFDYEKYIIFIYAW